MQESAQQNCSGIETKHHFRALLWSMLLCPTGRKSTESCEGYREAQEKQFEPVLSVTGQANLIVTVYNYTVKSLQTLVWRWYGSKPIVIIPTVMVSLLSSVKCLIWQREKDLVGFPFLLSYSRRNKGCAEILISHSYMFMMELKLKTQLQNSFFSG